MSIQNASPSDDRRRNTSGNHLLNIPVTVDVIIGQSELTISQLMSLQSGAIIQLDRKIGELSDISVNGRVIARGSIIVIEDGKDDIGISITHIVQPSSAHS